VRLSVRRPAKCLTAGARLAGYGERVLSGSTNYLADRGLSETLAGRAGRLQLWPLSMGERFGPAGNLRGPGVRAGGMAGQVRQPASSGFGQDPAGGGFPEVVTEGLTVLQRRNWFDAYVHDVVSREALRPLAEVRLEAELRKLLRLLAARTGQELPPPGTPATC
jgi:uncharacterized protein